MKLKNIKTEQEVIAALGDAGVLTEAIIRDGGIKALQIGNLHITSPYSTLEISRVVEFEEEERYRVRVDHPHIATINRYFDHESGPARDLAASFENMPDAKVTAGMVKVHVDAAGKVIAEVDGDTVSPLAPQENGGDDIPF